MVARGGWLLLMLMFGLTVYDLGRLSSFYEEGPALRLLGRQGMLILLRDESGKLNGIHQINDAGQLLGVIRLTGLAIPAPVRLELLAEDAIAGGKMLEIQVVDGVVVAVEYGWMPAAMRIALDIPLRLDRMSGADWEDLPGVGPTLALRIAQDRHENGGFAALHELQRVKGIGPRRIEEWRAFFMVTK